MNFKVLSMVLVVPIFFLTTPSWSQDLIVYPAKGQSNDQMEKDKYECYKEIIDGKLILQGAEDGYEKMRDGLGWTIAISEETGQVVLTASGEQVAFVVFGAALAL